MHPIDILFWSCLFLGGAYTVATLLMGGFSHAAGHLHVGDLSHAGHLIGHGHAGQLDAGGHAHAGDAHAHAHAEAHHGHEADAEEAGARFSVLAYLNPMAVAGFMLGFGGAGVFCRLLGIPPLASALGGTASGFTLWLAAYLVATKMIAASEGTSHNLREELVGMRAKVTVPITSGRPGMVCYIVNGARQSVRAITEGDDPIPVGAPVRIRRIDASTAYVVRIDQIGEL